MPIKLHRSFAVHPGVWVREEIVAPKGVSITALAQALGVSRQAASTVMNGSGAISAEMAIRLEKLFGISADTLVRMQAAHSLAEARAAEAEIKVGSLLAA